MHYAIVIHKDDDSDYGVTVPDLPGCFSAGDTVDNAIFQAKEAIECHLEGLLMDGDAIPEAGLIEAHQANSDYSGGIWAIVNVDLSRLEGKVRRINITIPEHVLTMIDEAAKREGESRSGFLARAGLDKAMEASRQ